MGRSETPPSPTAQHLHSRKEGHRTSIPEKAKRTSVMADDLARQQSAEQLRRLCDQSFRPDVGGSKLLSSDRVEDLRSDDLRSGDLRSRRSEPLLQPQADKERSLSRGSARPLDMEQYQNRPLPAPPAVMEAKPSETFRALAEQKEKLMKTAELLQPGQLDDVIAQIDRLMAANAPKADKRTVSAPPVGTELSNLFNESEALWNRTVKDRRSASAPLRKQDNFERTRWDVNQSTIRMVDEAELSPLNVRKKQSAPYLKATWNSAQFDTRNANWTLAGKDVPSTPRRSSASSRRVTSDEPRPLTSDMVSSPLETIAEDAEPDTGKRRSRQSGSDGRIKNWFRRSISSPGKGDNEQPPTPPSKDSPFKRRLLRAKTQQRPQEPEEEFPMRPAQADKIQKGPGRLLRFFGVKGGPKPAPRPKMDVLSRSLTYLTFSFPPLISRY